MAVRAQHADHPPATEMSLPMQPEDHEHAQHETMSTGALGISTSRVGSGTAWLPDASPMRGFQLRSGGWQVMLHGNLFAGYDIQAGGHELGGGHLVICGMSSLEPLTVGRNGYPLRLQSGEAVDGVGQFALAP